MFLLSGLEEHIKRITVKASDLIKSRYGLWFLGLLSFVESTLLIPLITDPFMIAYILVRRTKVIAAVVVTTMSSVFGGFVAFITASFFIDLVMKFMSPGSVKVFNDMVYNFKDETFLLAFLGALTPVPFTLAALAAGAIKGNLLLFLLGALIGRAIRYGIGGYLAYRFGDRAVELAKKNIGIISIFVFVAVILYIWLKM
jgi:membrane protein YqaA with SNARE-associated domain